MAASARRIDSAQVAQGLETGLQSLRGSVRRRLAPLCETSARRLLIPPPILPFVNATGREGRRRKPPGLFCVRLLTLTLSSLLFPRLPFFAAEPTFQGGFTLRRSDEYPSACLRAFAAWIVESVFRILTLMLLLSSRKE